MNISGTFRPADGQPPASVEAVTIAVFAEETGGTPLWQETQSVQLDQAGSYTLLLGATHADGVPLDVFATGEAKWLSIVFARPGEAEGPRVRLTSVPYALRASDAETLGGRSASEYLLAPTAGEAGGSAATAPSAGDPIGPPSAVLPGTTNFLAKYVNASDVGNSAVYETNGLVGIGTTGPLDALQVQFTNNGGTQTGFAVQNLGATASSYSGMLFYDQNSTLGLFQGFNNVSHEYRINNVARDGGGFFNGSINFLTGSTSRFFVNSLGSVGIGTTLPASLFEVSRFGGADIYATAYIGAAGVGGLPNSPTIQGRIARGNAAAPTAVQNGDLLAMFSGGGYGSTGFTTSKGGLAVRAAQTWTDSVQGTYLRFLVTATGSPAPAEVMGINANGFVGIGTQAQIGTLADRLQVFGDIRVGTSGTNGCINNFSGAAIAGVCSSDLRFKKDVTPFGRVLGPLTALQPVHYSWRAAEFPDRHFGDSRAYGLIAQEAEQVLPELVVTGKDGFKAVDYSKLPLLTIQAVKELKAQNDALTARVAELERLITELVRPARQ